MKKVVEEGLEAGMEEGVEEEEDPPLRPGGPRVSRRPGVPRSPSGCVEVVHLFKEALAKVIDVAIDWYWKGVIVEVREVRLQEPHELTEDEVDAEEATLALEQKELAAREKELEDQKAALVDFFCDLVRAYESRLR